VVLLAKALSANGWPVSVVSLMEPSAYVEELTAAGVSVHSLGMKPGRPGPLAVARLLYLLGTRKPAILHSHMFHANLLTRMVSAIYAAPVVISTIHSLAESSRRSGNMKSRDRIYTLTDRLSDYTTCVSEAIARRYLEIGAVSEKKLRVIPNGVDASLFQRSAEERARIREQLAPNSEFLWLAAGRLMWKKDYTTMLEAMARRSQGTLLVAGEGPLEAELRARAESLQVPVRFLGLRSDIPALMNACDGFVLSSVVEGLPMVLLEAAHAGLPCVTTDVAGAREAVVDGETGFIVPVQNPDALAEAMARVVEMSPGERRQMGRAARLRASERFDIRAIAGQWEALYRQGLEVARRELVL
jgi:glycosyltransferase involved in cell wall biosynthesis